LLKKIITKEKILAYAAEIKKKRIKPGFDGMSADGAYAWLTINNERVYKELINTTYKPMPAIGFRTAKMNGGFRQLSRITVIDYVIQGLLNRELSDRAEGSFSDNSFAYRTGRGVHKALERYVSFANKYPCVVKLDCSSCFSNIDHAILERSIQSFFNDESLTSLLMAFVKTPLSIDGEIVESTRGLLQGMPLSPLLSNVYLHSADLFLTEKGIPFIRYGDDTVIFAQSINEATQYRDASIEFYRDKLALDCNSKKTAISSPANITYLGYKFSSDKKGVIAYQSDESAKTAYYNWHSTVPQNNRKRVDVLSDGILRQKDLSILLDTETQDTPIPVVSIDTLNVYSSVILDSGFLNLCFKNQVCVNVFDKHNELIGSFVPNAALKNPRATHEQLKEYYNESDRLILAREFVLASIHNSLLNVRYYNKQTPMEEYEHAIDLIQQLKAKIKAVETHNELMLLEAQARALYFGCFDYFIKRPSFRFEKRTRRPPKNEVNAMISFGNTVMYGFIKTEIQKTALDVRVGFLHATNDRAASLNLDIAEIFKPLIVDRVIFTLINKGMINERHFTLCENGAVYMTTEGQRVFLRAFYDKLSETLTVGNESVSYDSIIKTEIRKLVRHFKQKEKYKAYRQVR